MNFMTRTSSAGITVTLPRIEKIGIADRADVVEHRINEVYGSVSHYVRFRNGGELRVVRAADGSLLEFSGEGVTMSIDREGAVSVRPYQAPVGL